MTGGLEMNKPPIKIGGKKLASAEVSTAAVIKTY